ncbi:MULTISPECIES: hypothetical protein [Streptomyces]|uniref:Uncharacterized protein n=1 Tax=Streptomyces griseiscabiei TaxID=2993540 RepID=A0ABU4LDQ9_9ACTN|nr:MULTISPECIES: hypothetical protein [Streptomyces]AHE39939.1 hypothetical protein pFRL5_276c [Streptomyces sp. F8]MBZ3908386.1 hypothetical protein [Streptomyces griseiscabiei]MDX2913901.1 hypothetical protein [Streptomyces griseiscabiei]
MTLAPEGELNGGCLDARVQLHLPVAASRLTLATTPGTLLAARAQP